MREPVWIGKDAYDKQVDANAQIWRRYMEVCDANVGWAERGRIASLANAKLEAEVKRLAAEVERLRPTLTKAEAEKILAENEQCKNCGRYHSTFPACSRVKAILMDGNGTVLRVTYWPHGQWQPEGFHPDELGTAIALEVKDEDVKPTS